MIKSVLIIMASIVAINGVGIYESTYTRNAEVTKVLNESLVTFTDDTGNEWDYYFEDGTDLEVGNKGELVMNTMHTDNNIYDDKIKNVVLDK